MHVHKTKIHILQKHIHYVKTDVRLVALWGEWRDYREKCLHIGRVSCPPQTYKSESLSVGTRSLRDSYVQPAFGTNGCTLIAQDNTKAKVKYNLYQ